MFGDVLVQKQQRSGSWIRLGIIVFCSSLDLFRNTFYIGAAGDSHILQPYSLPSCFGADSSI
jgi:hypothetical protein